MDELIRRVDVARPLLEKYREVKRQAERARKLRNLGSCLAFRSDMETLRACIQIAVEAPAMGEAGREILLDALEHYGERAQVDMMLEEMAELSKALLKLRRAQKFREPGQWLLMEDVAEEIRKTGRPVVNISIQADGGVTKAIQDGIAAVEDLKRQAEAQKREPCPLSGLIIGGYNGGSDWTSGLSANPVVGEAIDMHLSAGGRAVEVCGRGGYPTTAASYEIGMRLMDIGDFFNEDCTRRGGKGLSQVNPTPGNKAGGLTTMTEKNLGSFKTQGHRRILGILDCGDPVPGAGAWGINQAQGANDAYASTTLAMSGCHICLFTTGRGNPIGNACMTTIKITGNPQTATALEDMIDYSAAPMLYGELSLQESGRELYELLLRVANGEETKAEKLGDYSWTTPHGTSYNGDY